MATQTGGAAPPPRPSQQPTTAIVDSSTNLKAAGFQTFLEKFKPQLERVINKKFLNPEKMLGLVVGAFMRNEDLQKCTTISIVNSMIHSAQLGLEPNTPLGHAWLIPYKGECTFQIGYKGLIELALRSGRVHDVKARLVYESDKFSLVYSDKDELVHTPFLGPEVDRGKWYLAYSRVRFKEGDPSFDWMSFADIMYVKNQSVKTDKVWGPWEEAMVEKTVAKKHLKWVKLSEDLDRGIGLDDQAIVNGKQDLVIDVGANGLPPARIFPVASPQQKPPQQQQPQNDWPNEEPGGGIDQGGFSEPGGGDQKPSSAEDKPPAESKKEVKQPPPEQLTVEAFTGEELARLQFVLKSAGVALNRTQVAMWLGKYFPDDKPVAIAAAEKLLADKQGGQA